MGEALFEYFSAFGKEAAIFIISMLPIVELRGAIPIAAICGIPPLYAFLIALVGNLLPVPFLILLSRPIFAWLKKTKLLAPLSQKLEAKIMKKADKMMKISAIGLFVFVAIPLPGTGAWTGAVIASLLDMRFKYALPAISLGVVAAGVIMTIVSYGIKFLVA